MPSPLARVKLAARRRGRAGTEYREAIRAAVAAGETFADIGRAAGITRQAARTLASRQP